jgi:TonB-dependent starch-binding outer membrane protein SusC
MKLLSNTFSKSGLLVVLLAFACNIAFAQRTVKGKVTDSENGDALIGATVAVVGTTRGAVTDIDGNYSVGVPAGATQLRFSYTGFAEQIVTLGTANVLDVKMVSGTKLDEVVVVGYGTLKAREVTSSVSTVKAADFNKGNVSDAAALIQGKVPGLVIARAGNDPNGGFNIRLRGLSTASQNTSPLIVIDGVPGQSLRSIDPNDIESFDVLKDGSAAAIYGTRGSSGVILITTKKGQAGKSTVEYSLTTSLESIAKKYDLLNAADFVSLASGKNEGSSTDWYDEITRTGVSYVHGLNMSGGSNKTTYRASLNYRDAKGIAVGTGFKQYNANVAIQQKALADRLTINASMGTTSRDADLGFAQAFRYATVFNPTAPVHNTDVATGGYYQSAGSFDIFNPVAMIEQGTNKDKINNLFGNIKGELKLMDGLSVSAFYNQSRETRNHTEYYKKQAYYRGNGGQGRGTVGSYATGTELFESTLNYTKGFGKVGFKGLLGYSHQVSTDKGTSTTAYNTLLDELTTDNLGANVSYYNGLSIPSSFRAPDHTLIAFFGRASFDFDDTYFLTASLRREGSSRFGINNRWGLFPAVSAGVQLNKLIGSETFNNLKLRAGYGVTGGTPLDGGLSVNKIGPLGNFFYSGGQYLLAYGPTGTNANPNLKWERKSDISVGLDWAIMDYKLSGTVDYYKTNTTDLLFPFSVPVPPNFSPLTWLNVGELQNSGVELSLNYAAINKENLTWTTGLIASTYKTKLVDLYNNFEEQLIANVGAPGLNDEFYTQIKKGESIGNLYVRDFIKIGDDGKYVFREKGTGAETSDPSKAAKIIAGNGLPKFDLGWNNSMTMGQFDLGFLLRGVFGHSLANEYRIFYESLDPSTKTWNKVKTKYFDTRLKDKNSPSSYHVEKADYIRLENITLGYNVKLPGEAWFSKARIFVNAQNPFLWTKYSGVDPEVRFGDQGSVDNENDVSQNRSNPLAPGIDRRTTYFRSRSVSLGVNFGF